MATVTTQTKTVYILTLSEDEAVTLRDILLHVGGPARISRRGYADAILDALDRQNLPDDEVHDMKPGSAIYFENV